MWKIALVYYSEPQTIPETVKKPFLAIFLGFNPILSYIYPTTRPAVAAASATATAAIRHITETTTATTTTTTVNHHHY